MFCRAVLFLLLLAGAAFPLQPSEVLETVAPLATALSNGDSNLFVSSISKNAANRRELADTVHALVSSAEITCSIEVASIQGDIAELDWSMQLSDKVNHTVIERRQGKVRVRVLKGHILELGPVDFFLPPKDNSL